jgi:hypothetical protein
MRAVSGPSDERATLCAPRTDAKGASCVGVFQRHCCVLRELVAVAVGVDGDLRHRHASTSTYCGPCCQNDSCEACCDPNATCACPPGETFSSSAGSCGDPEACPFGYACDDTETQGWVCCGPPSVSNDTDAGDDGARDGSVLDGGELAREPLDDAPSGSDVPTDQADAANDSTASGDALADGAGASPDSNVADATPDVVNDASTQ